MFGFIKSMFGIDRVADTAMKIVDKIAGTDFTAKEKAEFVLKYQESTKHQSPARRFIAIALTLTWAALVVVFVVGLVMEHLMGVTGASGFSDDIKAFMYENVKEPFNYVIMFYFAMGALSVFKK